MNSGFPLDMYQRFSDNNSVVSEIDTSAKGDTTMKAPGNEAQVKAIADANAALNNVDLPNYSELINQVCQQNAKLEKLVIQVEVKNVYGVDKIYPANKAAEILAKIAGKKTLNDTDCALAAALGFVVEEVVSNKLKGVYFPALQKAAGVAL